MTIIAVHSLAATLFICLYVASAASALSSNHHHPRWSSAAVGDGGWGAAGVAAVFGVASSSSSSSSSSSPTTGATTTIAITRRDAVTRQLRRSAAAVAASSSSTTMTTIAASPRPASAAAASSSATTATVGGLASRLAKRDPSQLKNSVFNVPPGPAVYPPFVRGTWDVTMKFRGFVFPSSSITKERLVSDYDVPGFQKLSMAMVGDVGRESASYVMIVDPNTGLEDRRTSLSTSINSHLGYEAVRDVVYDPRENPNRVSIDFVPNRTRNANRIELFCNARESELVTTATTTASSGDDEDNIPSSIFFCSEHVRQVTFGLSREYGVARQVSGNYAHYWTWREGRPGTTKMTGNLLTAAYLDAQDPLFFDEPSRPVVVYSHDLVATRRLT